MKTIINIAIGLGAAIVTIISHQSLGEAKGLELTSFLLVMIGSAYFGFALSSHSKRARIIEIIVASAFVLMAIYGLWVSPWILIVGLFLHGVWDLAHHNNVFNLAEIPKWYVPFCASYDWVMAIYLAIVYM